MSDQNDGNPTAEITISQINYNIGDVEGLKRTLSEVFTSLSARANEIIAEKPHGRSYPEPTPSQKAAKKTEAALAAAQVAFMYQQLIGPKP